MHQRARVTGQVAHPNVVSVLDLGEDHGDPFAVMERLEGAPLTVGWRHAPLDRRLDVMRQVCDGLSAAHERGVVHGAVKPSHVFIQSDAIVKLLDFGSDEGGGPYASPEQMTGRAASERSDVYSAGATFQMLLSDDAPDALRCMVTKAMQPDPHRRHVGMAHLRAEIEQLQEGRQGVRQRILIAAIDRYRAIESLVAQRRALGRRLGLPATEQECDAKLVRLAAGFPEFARAGHDVAGVGEIDASRASEALTALQLLHNDVAAEVSVLRAASGGRR